MRKFLGNWGEAAIVKPLLRAATLFLLLSAAFCHAQLNCTMTDAQYDQAPGTQFTLIGPTVWPPGQITTVTLTGSWTTPSLPVGCWGDSIEVMGLAAGGGGTGVPDPNVTISNIAYNPPTTTSPPTTTFTVTVLPQAPNTQDWMVIQCLTGACPEWSSIGVQAMIQTPPPPPPCPASTVASVSPNIWWAGQTKTVTVTGTNFVTPANAAPGCPATTATVSALSGAAIALGTVTVNSATQITIASVAPPSSETTEGATVALSGEANGEAAPPPNADVLGAPQIQWKGKTISGSGATAQSTVVGQNVVLTGIPTATTLGNLPIHVTFTQAPGAAAPWTAGGTNIGGYPASTAGASVTATVLSQPTLSTYWVVPQQSVPVSYEYCVDTPSQDDLCPSSPAPANATFKVTGPSGGTMSFKPYLAGVSIANLSACSDPPLSGGPYLAYSQGLTGSACPTGTLHASANGITFNSPTGYSNTSGGSFKLVQLISGDVVTGVSGTEGAGLDTQYPYPGPPSNDNPALVLPSTPGTVTRTFTANMFLMWQSSTTNSIPVPLGYQTWGFDGSATCSKNCGTASNWKAKTSGTPGPVGGFEKSSASQTQVGDNILVDGYPTWTVVSR